MVVPDSSVRYGKGTFTVYRLRGTLRRTTQCTHHEPNGNRLAPVNTFPSHRRSDRDMHCTAPLTARTDGRLTDAPTDGPPLYPN